MSNRVFVFFTFCTNLFHTILRVQIGMKNKCDSFFEKNFFLHTLGGCERFFGERVCLILCNSKTTAPRVKIFTSIDSETQISYLCLIHSAALTGLFLELFLKNCFSLFYQVSSNDKLKMHISRGKHAFCLMHDLIMPFTVL